MTDFLWGFPSFNVVAEQNGCQNVVTGINWICSGTDGANTTSMSGSVTLPPPDPETFIPYPDVTEAVAMSWLSGQIQTGQIETAITQQLATIGAAGVPSAPPF